MTNDPNEGHAENCACLHPGDRECNCHKAYGFATADEMAEADSGDVIHGFGEWQEKERRDNPRDLAEPVPSPTPDKRALQ